MNSNRKGEKLQAPVSVSAIIVNYRREKLLRRCLFSLKRQSLPLEEVIVIDNGSCERSLEMIKREFPEVRLIINKKNLYFARSYNQGIDLSKNKYLLLLNNDIILEEDFLIYALEPFKYDEKIWAVCGKLLAEDKVHIDSTGQFFSLMRRAIERGYRRINCAKFDKPGYVFGVPGACALYRREVLCALKNKYGYFDERFKAYLEDLDLNWRANNKGWRCYYNPKACAYHIRGSTGWKLNYLYFGFLKLPFKFKLRFIYNRYLLIIKNDKTINFLRDIFPILAYDCYLTFALLFHPFFKIVAFSLGFLHKIIKPKQRR